MWIVPTPITASFAKIAKYATTVSVAMICGIARIVLDAWD
jgi:hypothetical protein